MYRKNIASQNIAFALLNASTGAAVTGATVSGYRCIDGGAQAAVTGTISEKANGQYNLALSQADTNGDNIGFLFTAAGAIPVHFTVVTANANILADIADAVLKRDWTAVTGEASRSVLNALRFLRNKWSISGASLTVTKEDDTASAWSATVTADAGASPISAVDPT